MAHPSARRPPADLIPQQQQVSSIGAQRLHQGNYLRQRNGSLSSAPTPMSASSKGASVAPVRSNAPAAPDLVRPHYRGHQRRQSVARLLPDISKLRLLSWLVEASNELINCDIAIMDGVYAKLNRSRESLLFWQQSQQQQRTAGGIISRAGPPPPPAAQPVANKTEISKRHEPAGKSQPMTTTTTTTTTTTPANQSRPARSKLFSQKRGDVGAIASDANSSSRSHHSLPLTNYDASSLAATSMKSSTCSTRSKPAASNTQSEACVPPQNQSASDAIAASLALMMRQNSTQQRGDVAAGQPTPGARNNRSLPGRLPPGADEPSADYCDDITSNQSDDEDDDNSSAASSTTSSGIHGASSSSSSAASSTSSSGSSSVESSCSLEGLSLPPMLDGCATSTRTYHMPATGERAGSAAVGLEQTTTDGGTAAAASPAEQLSERIRRAVMEHNYLQSLLVNVIRQHDRQRERQERQLLLQLNQSSAKLDVYGRQAAANPGELSRIDLAAIVDALDDGCQCSCHHSRTEARPASPLGASSLSKTGRASTLPTSSSLSLFQPTSLVPTRKNRRKKASEPSREDIIQRLADKLCENCFETHYWLHSCATIESPAELQTLHHHHSDTMNDTGGETAVTDPQQERQQTTAGASQLISSSSSTSKTATSSSVDLDSIVALRNATFIRLVQQQVRTTISNSIELIDLIRREIKSPESIKQKQLMRCFSASIQLLSSVASYVVPSQDISTFITTEMVPGGRNKSSKLSSSPAGGHGGCQQQATTLFNLPASDFDHTLLFPHHHQHSAAGLGESFLSNHHQQHHRSPHAANHLAGQQQRTNNYHLAQAPEIPLRRRHNQHQHLKQRRSFDEASTQDRLHPHPRVHLLSLDEQSSIGSFRSLPPDVNTDKLNFAEKSVINEVKSLKNEPIVMGTTVDQASELGVTANSNPNGGVESSSGASSNNSSASSSIARGQVQQSSLKAHTNTKIRLDGKSASLEQTSLPLGANSNFLQHHPQRHGPHSPSIFGNDDLFSYQTGRAKFWQSSKFNFIKKLLQVKQQRLLRQQSKDRRIYNHKVANKFRLVMMDLIHFNKSQQLLTTENGVNSLLTSMRNVLEFGLYLTVKLY